MTGREEKHAHTRRKREGPVSDQKLIVTDTGQRPVSGSVNDCVPMISGQDKVDLRHLEV